MTMTRRQFTLGAAAAASALVAGCGGSGSSGSGSGSGSRQKVNFGYIGDFNGTSLLAIADSQGMWDDHGLDVSTRVFTNGPLQIQALGTGDLDFGYIGPGAMWLPASGQAKIVAINTLGNADRVIAQPGITSLGALRSKTIGVPQGTSGDMVLTLALQKAGLSKSDVKIVPMDPSTVVSAFSAGKVDAAGFWYPAIASIKKRVPGLVELAKDSDFSDQVSFPTAFVAGNSVVSDQRDKATRVVATLRDAMRYRTDHPDDAIAVTAKMLKVDPASVRADAANVKILSVDELDSMTKDGTIVKWLDGMADFFVQAGELKSKVDGSTYYTGDLFTSAGT